MGWIFGAILFVLFLVIIISNIAVVQQSRAYVIERLGAFQTVWGVGLQSSLYRPYRPPCFPERAGAGLPAPAGHYQRQCHHADRYRCVFPDPRPLAVRLRCRAAHGRYGNPYRNHAS